MKHVKTADYLSVLKMRVYQRSLFIGALVILFVWIVYIYKREVIFLDSLVYPIFLVFTLASLLLFNRFGGRFLKPFEYSAFTVVFIYFLAQFVQEAFNGTYHSGLDFRRFLLWIAILYTFAFLIFPSRKAVYWSAAFLACIFIVGIGYCFLNWEQPGFRNDIMTLTQIYASGLIYISLFYAIAMLKDQYTEAEIRSEVMTRLANVDTLTRAHSRIKINELLSSYIFNAQTYGHTLSIIILDVDKLKQVNDTYGHNAGDYVLRRMVELLQPNIRENDFLGRWGGDEFLVVCPNTGVDQVSLLANRLEKSIADAIFTDLGRLSVSAGVATYQPGENLKSLLKRADDEMYRQKQRKRQTAHSQR